MKLKRGSRHEQRGWLFDVYPSSEGMVLWVITEEGERLKLIDSFHPTFYFDGPSNELRKVFLLLSREATSITVKQVERIEFFSGESIPVVQVTLQDPTQFFGVVKQVTRLSERLKLYNCDISLPQLYFYERNVFPLAFCSIAYTEAGRVLSIQALDSAWDLDYSLPPFRFLALKLEGELINPNHGWRGKLEIHDEQECHVLEGDDPAELITLLNNHL